MPWLTVKIRVKTDGVRKGGAGGTVTRLCDVEDEDFGDHPNQFPRARKPLSARWPPASPLSHLSDMAAVNVVIVTTTNSPQCSSLVIATLLVSV